MEDDGLSSNARMPRGCWKENKKHLQAFHQELSTFGSVIDDVVDELAVSSLAVQAQQILLWPDLKQAHQL